MGASCERARCGHRDSCMTGSCETRSHDPATSPAIAASELICDCPPDLLLSCSWGAGHTYASVVQCMMLAVIQADPEARGKLGRGDTIQVLGGLIATLAKTCTCPGLVVADVELVCQRFAPEEGADVSISALELSVCEAYAEWAAGRLLRARFLKRVSAAGTTRNTVEARHAVLRASTNSRGFCIWLIRFMFPQVQAVAEFEFEHAAQLHAEVMLVADRSAASVPARRGFEFSELLRFCQQEAAAVAYCEAAFAEAHATLVARSTR
eukprot:TRINITY_DN34101_c0_g1_i1.p1 TRINITY_DN34101_c0_g1~~TRINITY_DN34101_c0_g1_i1.p1  ORF type:complete len:266 (-),score=30.88 TRINITY_DN34101_c0_g1_i1:108-905(-)